MNVKWFGCPVVSDNAPGKPRTGFINLVQIGFREDGVVVWRDNVPRLDHPATNAVHEEPAPVTPAPLLKDAKFVEKIPESK